jgi:protein O-mannosyl-transferase
MMNAEPPGDGHEATTGRLLDIASAESMSRQRLVWLIVIVIGAALTFCRALSSDYVTWDDDRLILKNVYLTAPFFEAMWGVWSHSFDGDYLPIPFFSYWLEVRSWGFDPLPQHAVNWLLHLANICLVSVWLSRIRIESGLAFVITMVFALHPLQTESVLWIAERKGLLSSFFLLLGLIAFENAGAPKRTSPRWILMWTVCFTLSCLCKVTGIFLPLVLVMDSRFIKGQTWQESLRPNFGTGVVMVGFCILRYVTYETAVPGIGTEAIALTHWLRLPILIPTAIGHYIISLVYPFNLSIIYPSFAETRQSTLKLLIGAGYLALLARAALKRRSEPQILFGALSVALLLPVLNVIPRLNFVNDRYMYLPIIGVTGFLGSLVAAGASAVPRVMWTAACACLALGMGGLSFSQSQIWHDSLLLWQDTVQRTPGAQVAWNNLGNAQRAHGNARGAEQSFLTAMQFRPHQNALAFVNLAGLYLDPGQPTFNPQKAYQILTSGLEFAAALNEQFALRFNIGVAQLRMNQPGAATTTFRALLADMEKASSDGYHRNLENQVRDVLSRIDR